MPERFDLVPPDGLRRVALAMAEGAKRYGENNYLIGPMPVEVAINHALRHLYLFLSGDREEDHLSHAGANILMSMEVEKRHDGLRD